MNSSDGEVEIVYRCQSKEISGCDGGAKTGPVLVMDASYNPPTRAHLQMVIDGVEMTRPSRVILSLSITNVEKQRIDSGQLSLRKTWIKALADEILTVCNVDAVMVVVFRDARLFIHKGKLLSRSLDNVEQMIFLMGDDTAERFFNMEYYGDMNVAETSFKTFFRSARLIIFARKYSLEQMERLLANWIKGISPMGPLDLGDRISVVQLPEELRDISSTKVRKVLLQQKSITTKDLLNQYVPSRIARLLLDAPHDG